jgi:hypothetical protein
MEDERSIYTNEVGLFFKGAKPLKLKRIEYASQSKSETITSLTLEVNGKKKAGNALDNFKNTRWSIFLQPNDSVITLRFFHKKDANNKSTSQKEYDEIVIYCHKTDVLVSPECGIRECYIIDRVTTSFESSTILVPDGKVIDPGSNKTCHVEILY